MKGKIILLFLLVFNLAHADIQLHSASYLNKMSQALRGLPPSEAEYATLAACKTPEETQSFLVKKRTEYLASPFYVEKMRARLDELFKLQTMAQPINSPLMSFQSNGNQVPMTRESATEDLLQRMASQNLSFDELLIGKKYVLKNMKLNPNLMSDPGFFADLDPDIVSQDGTISNPFATPLVAPFPIQFDANDNRVAGAITTPRFFGRYVTTAINKNRKRAAAIFSFFLCDSMLAAVPDPTMNASTTLKLQFPPTDDITPDDVAFIAANPDSIHGSQADCRACHYKLDPMGKTFLGSQLVPSDQAWPGRLTYKTAKGGLTDIPVAGIGELAKVITQQPEYVSCQVQRFWNWFIGNDVVLTPQVAADLAQKFEDVGRRTNDFVAVLLNRPEFWLRQEEDPVKTVARRSYEIFKKCQSCHQTAGPSDDYGPTPNMTLWPLGQDVDKKDPAFWMGRISAQLDLPNGGKSKKMPPAKSNWNLSRDEMLLIKKWIDLGGPNLMGVPQVKP